MPTGLAAASLLLGLATVALWVVSYWQYNLIAYEAYSGIGTEVISISGRMVFYHYNSYQHDPPPQDFGFEFIPTQSPMGVRMQREFDFSVSRHWWNRLGFFYLSKPVLGPNTSLVVISLPHWFVICIWALASFALVRSWQRRHLARKRLAEGHCLVCGYDLRATADRCPECGTVPDQLKI